MRPFLIALVLVGVAAPALPARRESAADAIPPVPVIDYRLPNGLRVILSPDRSAPVVAVSVTYDVGSRNERPGRSGFAHLFEHMMFQGSESVGRGEHPRLIADNGGTMNGSTNQDRTNYYETLPANQLELALFLEADRMRSLDLSQENLDNQRAVVQEERRQRYDNQPYGTVFETLFRLAYTKFAYRHSTIGSMEDLNAATLPEIREFFRIYYAPNNAALAVVGDFEVSRARALVRKHFGPIPRQPAPPAPEIAEPPLGGEKSETIRDRLARLPRVTLAYRTVPGSHADFYPLSLLASVLGQGRTSRLYGALVEKELALNASTFQMEGRGPALFVATLGLGPDASPERAQAAFDAQVAAVRADGVSERELARARTQARAAMVGRLSTALDRANLLSLYAIYFDDPGRVNTFLARLDAVTPADVRRVANTYLTPDNRVVVTSLPSPRGGGAPTGGASR